ncbi:N-acetylglucosamine kinase [Segniliparus rotundus]|uniref:N-acetylglucosamine kinase n=1 Tax=Segniliparus rotundus TaxID=286802 RepID=UPI0024786515|nr:BadF/BadG/BcrA/BcrD ATPase family protein [Segniliparus rotundus]
MGIDIGGSKTHALATQDAVSVLDFTTGSANAQSVSNELAGQRLGEIFARLRTQEIGSICVGAAGVDSERQVDFLKQKVLALAPGARVHVVHDTELLLPAAGKETGVALLCGTGSVALGRSVDGRSARAGGWGSLLGDEGSGFWIFREAVRHTLGQSDRGEQHDELGEALLADCQCRKATDLLDHAYANQERRTWANRAELVLRLAENGTPAAVRIREQAADALVELARTVRSRLGGALEVVLAGGLLLGDLALRALVSQKLRETGFTEISALDQPPALGALRLAQSAL